MSANSTQRYYRGLFDLTLNIAGSTSVLSKTENLISGLLIHRPQQILQPLSYFRNNSISMDADMLFFIDVFDLRKLKACSRD